MPERYLFQYAAVDEEAAEPACPDFEECAAVNFLRVAYMHFFRVISEFKYEGEECFCCSGAPCFVFDGDGIELEVDAGYDWFVVAEESCKGMRWWYDVLLEAEEVIIALV